MKTQKKKNNLAKKAAPQKSLEEELQEEINKLDDLINKHLPLNLVLQTVGEGLQANKVISAVGSRDAGAGTVDFIDVPDNGARLKAAEIALRLHNIEAMEEQRRGLIELSCSIGIDISRQAAAYEKEAARIADGK